MPLVREHLYVPDGRPPEGYDDGRDFAILLQLLDQGVSASTLECGIRGVALMREAGEFETWKPPIRRGAKLTMRMLFNTRHGVVQLLEQATDRYWRQADQPARTRGGMAPVAAMLCAAQPA